MTFSIMAAGTIPQVRAQIEAADASYMGDTSQFDRVKAFLLAAFNDDKDPYFSAFDAWVPGAVIEASGYRHGGVDSLSLTIRPMNLRVAVEDKAEVAE